jgi:hypothetical protein
MLPRNGRTELKSIESQSSRKNPLERYGFTSKIFTLPFVKVSRSVPPSSDLTRLPNGFSSLQPGQILPKTSPKIIRTENIADSLRLLLTAPPILRF